MLKFPRCNADKAEPIFPGLGRGFSFESALVLILLGRENNLALAFSDLLGFSGGGGGGIGGGGGAICCCKAELWLGEL